MGKGNLTSILAGILLGASALAPTKVKADDLNIVFKRSGITSGSVDLQHTNSPFSGTFNPNYPKPSLLLYSVVGNSLFSTDSRTNTDDSVYNVILTGDGNGSSMVISNPILRFVWVQQSDTNRIYTARTHIDSNLNAGGTNYDAFFNIPPGKISTNFLPNLNVTSPTNTSYIDISCRFLKGGKMKSLNVNGTNATLETILPAGVYATPQTSTNLTDIAGWQSQSNLTQYVAPTAGSFNAAPEDSNGIVYTNGDGTYTTNTSPSITFSNLDATASQEFYRINEAP